MTIVTIVIIAVVAAIGVGIVTSLMNGTGEKSCEDSGGTWNGSTCNY